MPTDGADFGRTRPCYGKVYTMARDGADVFDIAECVIRGVELDIRRDGGAPSFKSAVESVAVASHVRNPEQLLAAVDKMQRDFVDSPLTRHIAAAAEKVGLEAIKTNRTCTSEQAATAAFNCVSPKIIQRALRVTEWKKLGAIVASGFQPAGSPGILPGGSGTCPPGLVPMANAPTALVSEKPVVGARWERLPPEPCIIHSAPRQGVRGNICSRMKIPKRQEFISSCELLSRGERCKALIVQLGNSRRCDGMNGCLSRNRSNNLEESQRIVIQPGPIFLTRAPHKISPAECDLFYGF